MEKGNNKKLVILRSLCSGSQPLFGNNEVLNKNLSGRHSVKTFTHTSSSRSVSVRDIGRFVIPRTTTLRGDGVSVRGFTLIELLVVVLIVGILSAIALPQYQKAVMKARYATLKSLTRSIANAQEVYYLANDTYSSDFADLDIDMPGGKLDTSKHDVYHYNWGYCAFLADGNDKYGIACRNSLSNLRYAIALQHTDNSNAGKQRCSVENSTTNTLGHSICKQESGLSEPSSTNTQTDVSHYYW